ncbi:hypothetical protein OROHE_017313 [Orobanche hederae]
MTLLLRMFLLEKYANGGTPMLEDPGEHKKAFIDYFKRKQAGIYLSLAPLREKAGQKNVRFKIMRRKCTTFIKALLRWENGAATSSSCENGAAVFHHFCKILHRQTPPFDCILMDYVPVMDGSEATTRIREVEREHGVRTTIVGLSAHKGGEEVEKMMQDRVDAYFTKPLNKDNLLSLNSSITSYFLD